MALIGKHTTYRLAKSQTIKLRFVTDDTQVRVQSGTYLSGDQVHLYDNAESVNYETTLSTGAVDPPETLTQICKGDKETKFEFTRPSDADSVISKITNNSTGDIKYKILEANTFLFILMF